MEYSSVNPPLPSWIDRLSIRQGVAGWPFGDSSARILRGGFVGTVVTLVSREIWKWLATAWNFKSSSLSAGKINERHPCGDNNLREFDSKALRVSDCSWRAICRLS